VRQEQNVLKSCNTPTNSNRKLPVDEFFVALEKSGCLAQFKKTNGKIAAVPFAIPVAVYSTKQVITFVGAMVSLACKATDCINYSLAVAEKLYAYGKTLLGLTGEKLTEYKKIVDNTIKHHILQAEKSRRDQQREDKAERVKQNAALQKQRCEQAAQNKIKEAQAKANRDKFEKARANACATKNELVSKLKERLNTETDPHKIEAITTEIERLKRMRIHTIENTENLKKVIDSFEGTSRLINSLKETPIYKQKR
jgi:hypothetical protein